LVSDAYRLRVFENKILRIFGLKRDEVTRGWRKLHIEGLRDLYSLQCIIKIIKSRRIKWAGHVAWMGGKVTHMGYWQESQKETDYQEDQDIGGWIILRWILERGE
jgi:hypothetical protein